MPDPSPRPARLALAAIVLVGAVVLWTQAVQIQLWAPDEEYFVQLSRLLTEHFPSAVLDLPVQPFDERGIQRWTILLLAVPLGLVDGEVGVSLGRGLMCLAFTSAAIPAYVLARGVKLSPGWALVTALATVIVPWSVLTGSFLTESVAYPAALWALWGAWRACVRPGLRSDLIAIGVVILAGLARTNLLVLITVAPIAVTLHTLIGHGLRNLPRQMWRDHPLFSVLIVPGAIVVILNLVGIRPGPLARLSGGYVTSLDILDWGPVPKKMAGQISRILTGAGFLPLIAGLPWIVRQLARRTSPEAGALAISGLVGFLVVLFSTVYAAPEERYLMLAAPYLIIPGVVAIARREVPAWALAVAGVLAGILVWRIAWPFTTDPAFFLTDPSAAFVGRVLLSRLPGNGQLAFGLLVLAAAVALAVLVGRRRGATGPVWAGMAVVAALLAFQAVQAGYVVTKRVQMAQGTGSLADWTWVDDAVGRDAVVGIYAVGMANGPDYAPIWRDLTFYNRRVDRMVTRGFLDLQIPRYAEGVPVEIDRDGRMVTTSKLGIPRLLLLPTLFRREGVVADPVRRAPTQAVELVRLRGTPRVTYQWDGTERDGWLTAEAARAKLAIMPPALEGGRRRCVTVTLVAPAIPGTRTRWTASLGGVRRSGTLGQDGRARVRFRLRTGAERIAVTARGGAPVAVDGRRLRLLVGDTHLGACGRSRP